jgi:hypothetical protein
MSLPCDYSKTTAVNMPQNGNELKIYPNPVGDIISVFTNSYGKIEIMDASGKTIYSSEISKGINEISVNHLLKGIYSVKIQNEDNSIKTFKIVKS